MINRPLRIMLNQSFMYTIFVPTIHSDKHLRAKFQLNIFLAECPLFYHNIIFNLSYPTFRVINLKLVFNLYTFSILYFIMNLPTSVT